MSDTIVQAGTAAAGSASGEPSYMAGWDGAYWTPLRLGTTVHEWSPTLDANAHAAGDTFTALVEVENVVSKNGGSGRIVDFAYMDGDGQSKALEAHIFDRSVTVPALNAAWSISDADNQYRACAPITTGVYTASALNSQSSNPSLSVPFHCKSDDTSLFIVVVAREAITPTASGGMFRIRVAPD